MSDKAFSDVKGFIVLVYVFEVICFLQFCRRNMFFCLLIGIISGHSLLCPSAGNMPIFIWLFMDYMQNFFSVYYIYFC